MQINDQVEADRWVGVALDSQIQSASSHPVILNGRELALWRGESGPARVWDDRCPHRGMRLSFGFVRGNTLRCLYHGWTYGENGHCEAIPAHPDLAPPKTICASTHGTAAKYGIIWVNLSATRAAHVPDLPNQPGWLPVRSVHLRASAPQVLDGIAEFDYGEPARTSMPAQNACVVVLGSDTQLFFALQPIGLDKTGLHVVVNESGEPQIPRRQRLARQVARLRDTIEAGGGGVWPSPRTL